MGGVSPSEQECLPQKSKAAAKRAYELYKMNQRRED